MSFDEEVDEVWPHVPLDLALHIDEVGIWESFILRQVSLGILQVLHSTCLHGLHVLHDVLQIFIGS